MFDHITLRKFPYPFRCAVAFSNDAEYVTAQAFWDIHRFLNTDEDTPLGPGLDLPITDSLFLYSVDPGRSISYFEQTSGKPSPHAGWMRELMGIGCIDVLHAYGDFDGVGGFVRDMAKHALDELDRHQIKLRVWTNHGTVENTQNIGASQAYYQRGDLPGAAEYHADLMTSFGFRFCWLDFNATNRIGQSRSLTIKQVVEEYRASRTLKSVRELCFDNDLIKYEELRDGRAVYLFRRYRGPKRPDPRSIPDQICAEHLAELESQQGSMIVYQHFGCLRGENGRCETNRPPYFHTDTVEAFRRLSLCYHAGKIFVTGVHKLLRYHAVHGGLRWSSTRHANGIAIVVRCVEDAVLGRFEPSAEDLEAITFYTPDARHTEIFLERADGRRESVTVQANGKDHTSRESVTVPIRRWELPKFSSQTFA
jgi:hypothetical protein